jgi:NAD(P)-dependent dehydrogenase (short-subunit alcohol dehydrogenase family)
MLRKEENMGEMDGKLVLITGATNGIGKVAALELAKKGATVVIVGRNPAKTSATVAELKDQSRNPNIEMIVADLSSMAEVRKVADAFKAKHSRLDVLINNAGAVFSRRKKTVDGYEMTFALNHLSYFLLTNLLLDVLKASAPARIVNVASEAHKMGAHLDFDDLHSKKSYGLMGFQAYATSKLQNILFTYELARRLTGTGVTAHAMHPGSVATGFAHNTPGFISLMYRIVDLFALTPEQGADTIIYLASSPQLIGESGKYWEKRRPIQSIPPSYDETTQKRLWDVSEQLTGLTVTVASQ